MNFDEAIEKEEGGMEIHEALKNLLSKAGSCVDGNKLVWDIVTALRGPDSENERLKELTTAKIRKAIGLHSGAGYIVAKTPFLTAAEKTELDNLLLHVSGPHFYKHYTLAIKAIKKLYGVDLSEVRNQIEVKIGRVYDLPGWGKYVLAYQDGGKMILVSPKGSRQTRGLTEAEMLKHLTNEGAKDLGRCKEFLTEKPIEEVSKPVIFKGLKA